MTYLKNVYPLRGVREVKAHPCSTPTKTSGKMPSFFLPQKERKWQRLQSLMGPRQKETLLDLYKLGYLLASVLAQTSDLRLG